MKRTIKYISIFLGSLVLLFSGYYIGAIHYSSVASLGQLELYLSALNDIEKNEIENVKKSLNQAMDKNIILAEESSQSWASIIGEDETSYTYARILRYRKYSGYKYIPEDRNLKMHKKADDILNAK